MKIEIDGVEISVVAKGGAAVASRPVGKDRTKRPARDEMSAMAIGDQSTIDALKRLKRFVAIPTAHCTCDYRYGWSDHAEHCKSLHVAQDPAVDAFLEDD